MLIQPHDNQVLRFGGKIRYQNTNFDKYDVIETSLSWKPIMTKMASL